MQESYQIVYSKGRERYVFVFVGKTKIFKNIFWDDRNIFHGQITRSDYNQAVKQLIKDGYKS